MVADLSLLWAHFKLNTPTAVLFHKVFDIQLFLKFIHNGFNNQNSLKEWVERVWKVTVDKTAQKTDWFQTGGTQYITSVRGRIRRPQTSTNKSFLDETQKFNFSIQATCADFKKSALRLIYAAIADNSLPAKLVLTAHDEIILECAEDAIPYVSSTVSYIMVNVAQTLLNPIFPNPPMEVDIGFGNSWAEKP